MESNNANSVRHQPATMTTEQALHQAVAHHKAGQLQDAERLYRAILQAQPNHPDANHNLGVLAVQVQQVAAALPYFKVALETNPNQEQYWLSYADALLATGQGTDALNLIQNAIGRGHTTPAIQALRQKAEAATAGSHATSSSARKAKKHLSKRLSKQKLLPQAETDKIVILFNAGRYVELENRTRALVEKYPDSGFVWNILGASLQLQGKDAVSTFQKAVELLPDDANAYFNLGVALQAMGQLDQAVANYRRALEIKPDYDEALHNLGNTLKELGRLDEAVASYRRTLEIRPDYAEAHYNFGAALQDLGRIDEALTSYRRALTIKPNYVKAHNNLGNVLQDLGQLNEAAASYRRALEINPDFPEAHNNLGNVLKDQVHFDDATAHFRRALEINPDFAEAHNNLGNVLKELGQLDDARASYCRALEIKPEFAEAHRNLGNVLQDLGQFDDAAKNYRRALKIAPNLQLVTFNLGLTQLALGRYSEGWPCYEARTVPEYKKIITAPDLPFPSWHGEPPVGRSFVVIEEQGIGDDIQFCRYASSLKEKGAARVTLVCKDRLRPLFSRIRGIDSVIERGDIATIEPHDFWVYAQSLPLHFGTSVNTIPADVPYLFAAPAQIDQVAGALGQSAALKIGICWKGSAAYRLDSERSPGLSFFSPIFGIDGVRIYTLLPNSRAEVNASAGDKAVDIGHEIDEFTAPFEETAALIMNLDLVISSDTSIAHLAGALGKPVWLVLPYVAHWVWMTDREDSPWYPNTRLVRQTERGNWTEVFERVANKLKAVLAGNMSLIWPLE